LKEESNHLIDEDIDRKIILKMNLKFLGYDDGKLIPLAHDRANSGHFLVWQ
jgi:hypothetical protein